ncbi:MAG: 50S ribosomal protein L21 [Firmicutes bacterium]|nr:50S ribosomal protein L21 [Bacillota bacterium]MCL5038604.1 50S ribosomal protein L21 [Bacillota bacterium]
MYVIIESGGKQYKVGPGDTFYVERLPANPGDRVELDRVLTLVKEDGQVLLGTPQVTGAKVVAKVLEQGKGPKIMVFKYKNKVNYRRRQGHRQPYTRLSVEEIVGP